MSIKQLNISNFRNLTQIELQPHERFNIFYGKNGSGKTSILEAIYYLSHSKSFRSHINKRIIQHDQDKLSLFARINEKSLGLERDISQKMRIRIDEQDVQSVSELAKLLPLQLIDSQTYQLLDAGPEYRRQFVDWGVFHVEPLFIKAWQRYQKILKQRNAALKQKLSKSQIIAWDTEFVETANEIDKFRKAYLKEWLPIFNETLQKLLTVDGLAVSYYQGWRSDANLADLLQDNLSKDIQFGYTGAGPHRADLKMDIHHIPAKDVLSRGQKKLFVSTMRIAQGVYLSQRGAKALYLVDDLPAELDSDKRAALCSLLKELDTQVFITCVDKDMLDRSFQGSSSALFHVEQGLAAQE